MPLDRNANDSLRLRRNAQRTRNGAGTGDVDVVAPLLQGGTGIFLNLNAAGGLQSVSQALGVKLVTNSGLALSASGLTMTLADTSLQLGSNGASVRLRSNSGMFVNTGLGIQLDSNPGLVLGAAGLKVLLNGSSLLLGASGLSINTGGVGLTHLGFLTTKGDLLGFGSNHARLPIGTNGQLLTADSATTLGLKWADAPVSFTSPLTTKGDLIVFGTNHARLPVGTDGYVLVADAVQTLGVKWAALPTGYSSPLTTKGDVLSHDGTNHVRVALGTDGYVLTADSTQPNGVKWSSAAAASIPLTTKGDLLGHNGTNAARLGVGTNAHILTADDTQTLGFKWAPAPTTYTSPLTTKGDLATHNGTNEVRLPVGANGKMLTPDSSQTLGVKWGDPNTSQLYYSGTTSTAISATTELAFDQGFLLPADTLAVGRTIRATFAGKYIQATGTINLRVYVGPTAFLDLGVFTPITSATERSWQCEIILVCLTAGTTGTIRGTATLTFSAQVPLVANTTADFTINTTVSRALQMTAQWGTANAGNVINTKVVQMQLFQP